MRYGWCRLYCEWVGEGAHLVAELGEVLGEAIANLDIEVGLLPTRDVGHEFLEGARELGLPLRVWRERVQGLLHPRRVGRLADYDEGQEGARE